MYSSESFNLLLPLAVVHALSAFGLPMQSQTIYNSFIKSFLLDIIDTMLHGEYPVDDLVPSLDKAELKLALRDVQKVELLMSQRLTGLMASLQQANTMGSSAITEDKRRVVLSASTAFSAVLSRMRRAKSVSSTLVQFRDNLNIDKGMVYVTHIACHLVWKLLSNCRLYSVVFRVNSIVNVMSGCLLCN